MIFFCDCVFNNIYVNDDYLDTLKIAVSEKKNL